MLLFVLATQSAEGGRVGVPVEKLRRYPLFVRLQSSGTVTPTFAYWALVGVNVNGVFPLRCGYKQIQTNNQSKLLIYMHTQYFNPGPWLVLITYSSPPYFDLVGSPLQVGREQVYICIVLTMAIETSCAWLASAHIMMIYGIQSRTHLLFIYLKGIMIINKL